MKKARIEINLNEFPSEIRDFMEGATIYDSSCSDHAKVYYSNRGYYIKVEEKGKLAIEARAVETFARLHLGPRLLAYLSLEKDYMVTEEAPGEDCIEEKYLQNPKKLCKVLAEAMKLLHDTCGEAPSFCDLEQEVPVSPSMKLYEEKGYGERVKYDTFIHGDFCLPNVLLKDGEFCSFIDVGAAGMGDRHIDIYWALWSLHRNLQTDKYTDLFLDLYGRENVDINTLRLVAEVENLVD